MSETPKNHGKPWTPSDNAQRRKLASENTPTRVMGLKLGRTESPSKNPTFARRHDCTAASTRERCGG
jgi:hypothetical protein